MDPKQRKANQFRKLASLLKNDYKTTNKLYQQCKEFSKKIDDNNVNQKNPYIYAVAVNLQHFYTSLETIFKRIIKEIEGNVPQGKSRHQELLEQISIEIENVRPALISKNIKQELDELRRFRHIVRHGYEYELDWQQIKPLIKSLDKIETQLEKDIKEFNTFLLTMADEIESDQ